MIGTGAFGFNGDGMKGLKSWLYMPSSIRLDEQDRPVLADFYNLRVRRLEADGKLWTVAGSGWHANALEGPALESPLENPVDVVPDGDGGFYMAELHAARVLHVDPSGVLSIVAGSGVPGFGGDDGPALDATLSEAQGIALAPDGTIYIADTDNHCIRAIGTDGVIRRVAGDGESGRQDGSAEASRFSSPQRLEWAEDALWIADRDNHQVRRLDPVSGVVETVAGTGTTGWTGDGGPALEATLNEPTGLAFAEDGTFYIADSGNNVIRRVDPDGTIETVAGTGEIGEGFDAGPALDVALASPFHVDVDQSGRVWIADTLNSRIRVLNPE